MVFEMLYKRSHSNFLTTICKPMYFIFYDFEKTFGVFNFYIFYIHFIVDSEFIFLMNFFKLFAASSASG